MVHPKSIFMTGGTGLVGSRLVGHMLVEGHSLLLLVRPKGRLSAQARVEQILRETVPNKRRFEDALQRIKVIEGDVSEKFFGLSKAEIKTHLADVKDVFHCAASVALGSNHRDALWKQNVEGTKHVLEAALEAKHIRFHHISTAYVAGHNSSIVKEDNAGRPGAFNNFYEETKFEGEQIVRQFQREHRFPVTIYRPSIIVGDSRTGRARGFHTVYELIRALFLLKCRGERWLQQPHSAQKYPGVALEGDWLRIPLRVPGSEEKRTNYVPIDYVSKAIYAVSQHGESVGKTYHIVNPLPVTMHDKRTWICNALHISGIELVDPMLLVQHPMSRLEKWFAKAIDPYLPYLYYPEPIFDDSNTRKMLQGSSISCPPVTAQLTQKLVDFCIRSNWGKTLVSE